MAKEKARWETREERLVALLEQLQEQLGVMANPKHLQKPQTTAGTTDKAVYFAPRPSAHPVDTTVEHFTHTSTTGGGGGITSNAEGRDILGVCGGENGGEGSRRVSGGGAVLGGFVTVWEMGKVEVAEGMCRRGRTWLRREDPTQEMELQRTSRHYQGRICH